MNQSSPASQSNPPVRTILVAEDEAAVRALVVELLQLAGYHVLAAANAAEALALAQDPRQPIDVLVSDVAMPGLSGPALARQLRAGRPHLPLLFMSGYSDAAAMEEIQQLGRAAYLRKPFAPKHLKERVAELLETP